MQDVASSSSPSCEYPAGAAINLIFARTKYTYRFKQSKDVPGGHGCMHDCMVRIPLPLDWVYP